MQADDRHRPYEQLAETGELALAPGHQLRMGVGEQHRIGTLRELRRRPATQRQLRADARRRLPVRSAPGQQLASDELAEAVAGAVVEVGGQASELAAEVAHHGAGVGVVVARLAAPRVGGHHDVDAEPALEGGTGLPPAPRVEAVAAVLGRRGVAAAVSDDGEHDVGGGDLVDAGADRLESRQAAVVAHQQLHVELADDVARCCVVGRELFGGGRDKDAHLFILCWRGGVGPSSSRF